MRIRGKTVEPCASDVGLKEPGIEGLAGLSVRLLAPLIHSPASLSRSSALVRSHARPLTDLTLGPPRIGLF